MHLTLGLCRSWQTSRGKGAVKKPEGVLVGDGEVVSEERQRQMDERRGERYASSGGER